MRLAALALLVLAQLNLNQPSQQKAEQQLNDVAKESRELTDHYLEKHRQEETNEKLNDIEDAIIFDSLHEGDD
jgi:hypothetical protein